MVTVKNAPKTAFTAHRIHAKAALMDIFWMQITTVLDVMINNVSIVLMMQNNVLTTLPLDNNDLLIEEKYLFRRILYLFKYNNLFT